LLMSLYVVCSTIFTYTTLFRSGQMETDHDVWCHTYHIYFLHWLVWPLCIICRKKDQRNWYSQSIGSICKQCGYYAFQRFFKACYTGNGHCNTCSMDGSGRMVAKLSVPHPSQCLDIYNRRIDNNAYSPLNYQFPGNKSGGCESCGEFEK